MGDQSTPMWSVLQPVVFAALTSLFYAETASAYLNVNNTTLQRCSHAGMALTGFTRNSQCVDQDDDHGSHHICIDMASNSGGNFCSVTGQPNWCGSQMPCDGSSGLCPVKHWCVCQWAFASYIQRAGGCEKIQNIVCCNKQSCSHCLSCPSSFRSWHQTGTAVLG